MAPQSYAPPGQGAQRGFSLIELAVVMAIVGVVLGGALTFSQSFNQSQRLIRTEQQLDVIEDALVLYVAQHKRLPCPVRADKDSDQNGRDPRNDYTNRCPSQKYGVVPWAEIGLERNAVIDEWGHFITYRVDDTLPTVAGGSAVDCNAWKPLAPALADGMDLRACRAPDTADAVSRYCGIGLRIDDDDSRILDGAPSTACDDPDDPPPSGAAYVLVAHGPNGFGAAATDGSMMPTNDASADEKKNAVDSDVYKPGQKAYYAGRNADDIVRHKTIMQLAIAAGVGPRS